MLFGNLSRFSEGDCEVFFEQILNGLVTLLLHLQDPKPEVVKVSVPPRGDAGPRRGAALRGARRTPLSVPQACKFALRMCGPSMGCEGLCDMFLNHLREDRSLHYGEFMNNVCKHLVSGRGARGMGPALPGAQCHPGLSAARGSVPPGGARVGAPGPQGAPRAAPPSTVGSSAPQDL